MAIEAGWRPDVIQYEHKHLTQYGRRDLSTMLEQQGYRLWADHADVWGRRIGGREAPG